MSPYVRIHVGWDPEDPTFLFGLECSGKDCPSCARETVPAVYLTTASEPDNTSDTDSRNTVNYDANALY